MARTRTTKKLAQRIDLNYFKRSTPRKRVKFWLSLLLPLLALIWIGWKSLRGDHRVYSSGRMSAAHAVFEKECATCHVQRAGSYSAKAADSACLACHDGPIHHANQAFAPSCSDCHSEHRGRTNLVAASNQACAQCHSDLRSVATRFARSISSFQGGHPEFAVFRGSERDSMRDPGTIKLNHAIHLKPIHRGPTGPMVQLDCNDCHRSAAAKNDWRYSDPQYLAAKPSYTGEAQPMEMKDVLKPAKTASGREFMSPVKFATACASCHLLTFDKRFDEGVPHDKPQVVHDFLVDKFQAYIAAHPAELREIRDPGRQLSGKPQPAGVQSLTPAQWVLEHTAVAEELLWHKTCAQCHAISGSKLQETAIGRWSAAGTPDRARLAAAKPAVLAMDSPLPSIAASNAIERWLPHAKFNHDAHRGFTCIGCHERALKSTETSDILIPKIANCQTCHAPGPGYAESRCFECHTYHDWEKRKEVKPVFTLPSLRSGGR